MISRSDVFILSCFFIKPIRISRKILVQSNKLNDIQIAMKTILVANLKGGVGKTTLATQLAVALSKKGYQVALADADKQKSALQWLKRRQKHSSDILALDWRDESAIGDTPKHIDYLIIDASGSLETAQATRLIEECQDIIIPLQPSFYDLDSTKRFLKEIQRIKSIKKGKITVHVVANRVKINVEKKPQVIDFFKKIEREPVAWISERILYEQLAEHGQSIFDFSQKRFIEIQQQWLSLLNYLLADKNSWY